jgi:hypothetical protein
MGEKETGEETGEETREENTGEEETGGGMQTSEYICPSRKSGTVPQRTLPT